MVSKHLVTIVVLAVAYCISKLVQVTQISGSDISQEKCKNFAHEHLNLAGIPLKVISKLSTDDAYLAASMRRYSPLLNLYILASAERNEIKACLANTASRLSDATKAKLDCSKYPYLDQLFLEEVEMTIAFNSEPAAVFLFPGTEYKQCMRGRTTTGPNTISRALGDLIVNILNIFGPGDLVHWMEWLETSETKNSAVLIWLCVMLLAFYMGDFTIIAHMMFVYIAVTTGFKMGLGIAFALSLIDGFLLILTCRQDWVRGMGVFRH